MKRILFLMLLLGNVCMALADDVTCFLPQDYRRVAALPGEHLTLGVPDPNNGRTVCYRWSSVDCANCFDGPTDQPTVDVVMPSQPGTYHFTVSRISDHIQTCDVEVIVGDHMSIVSITPKRGCVALGEYPNISEFDIITTPKGKEKYVSITDYIKVDPNDVDNWNRNVCFTMQKDGVVYDRDTVMIELVVGDETSIDFDLVYFLNCLENIRKVFSDLKNIVEKTPGFLFDPEVLPMEPSGHIELTTGKNCCNDKDRQFFKVEFEDFGITLGARLRVGFNACVAQLGGFGSIIGHLSVPGVGLTFNGCGDDRFAIDLGNIFGGTVSIGLFGDIIDEDVIHAEGSVNGNLSTTVFKVAMTSDHKLQLTAVELCADFDMSYSIVFLSGVTYSRSIALTEESCWSVFNTTF